MSNIIDVQGLTKSYGSNPVVCNANFCVESGKITGLLGPNGCGKTTTMKIIAGLIKDYTGTVKVDGLDIGEKSKGIVSFLPEKTYLPSQMKICSAIDYFNDFYIDFDKNKAIELVNRFGLNSMSSQKQMSKGMQEKFQTILVMSRNAKLYMLDEPMSGIDPASRDTMLDIILNNYSPNSAILMSTHLIYDVERIFDNVIIMDRGQIRVCDTVDNIRLNTGKSVDEFFREVFRC